MPKGNAEHKGIEGKVCVVDMPHRIAAPAQGQRQRPGVRHAIRFQTAQSRFSLDSQQKQVAAKPGKAINPKPKAKGEAKGKGNVKAAPEAPKAVPRLSRLPLRLPKLAVRRMETMSPSKVPPAWLLACTLIVLPLSSVAWLPARISLLPIPVML